MALVSWPRRGRTDHRKLQERFDLINDASGEGLWDMSVVAGDPVNPKNVFWWSDQFRRLVGFSTVEEFPDLLESWSSRLHPEDSERVLNAFAAHLTDRTGRTPYDIEYRLKMKTGEYRWFRARGTTLRDAAGVPLRTAGSLADITDTKIQAQEMEVLIQRFELVNAASEAGLWDMSVVAGDPVNPKNVFWWSNQFRAMLGYRDTSDFPDVLSSWSDLLHPEDKGRTLQAFADHLLDRTGRTPYNVEYRLKRKTGEYRWYRARGTTLRTREGIPLRVAGSLTDISEEKEMMLRVEAISNDAVNAGEWLVGSSGRIAEDTRQQLRHARENASAIDELILSLRDTAKNAEAAAAASDKAGSTAREGGEAVHAAIAGIDQIIEVVTDASASLQKLGESSKQIGRIVSTIEGIAEQTNLLALNAAIEAARAGEHGRGFAVVADEVRKLAEQSAKSTQEISEMIASIQDSIQSALTTTATGADEVAKKRLLASRAGKALNEIIDATSQVGNSIVMVAAGAEEQLAVSESLESSTRFMFQVSEKNAESVGAIEEAVGKIDGLTKDLQNALHRQPQAQGYLRAA